VEISIARAQLSELSDTSVVAFAFEDEPRFDASVTALDAKLDGAISHLSDSKEIKGKFREMTVVRSGKVRVIVVGAGKRKEFSIDRYRSIVAEASRRARHLEAPSVAFSVGKAVGLPAEESATACVEGILLGLYRFDKYKSKSEDKEEKEDFPKSCVLAVEDDKEVAPAEKGKKRGTVLAESTNFARDLVNEPANVMTPTAFAESAKGVAQKSGLEITIFDKEEIEAMGMGAFLSVARGSRQPPKLVVLKYNGGGPNAFTFAIVGKGVTFDSGGISIKPSENMHYMTGDMAGAAACLGAIQAIAALGLPLRVIAVMPLSENLPDGNASKPGDIVTTHSGKTIEIINTDAEGRLLLADALGYVCEMPVHAVVDLATLTGAIGIALGHVTTGVFSTSEKLLEEIKKAANDSDERVWPMPLYKEYTLQVKGALADLKNTGGRYGGACTAAAFLKEFVGEIPWAHLDIAGTSSIESDKTPFEEHPYLPKSGATGVGVRLVYYLAERLSRMKSLEG